jgi:hypothetical protein
MVLLSSCKQALESHRDSSLKTAYSDFEASPLAQAIVAKSLPETAFVRPARYCASAIPHSKSLLEFDQHEHRYSPVFSKGKTWAIGKVDDEGRWLLRTQHFHRGKSQVGSLFAITRKAACRSVRATIALRKVLRAGRAA